jgi:hypothetical protein
MLEYTGAGDGLRLKMLVLHDDAKREYAYGPAEGLPDTKVGTLTQDLYEEAKKDGWVVISMKNDWKRIFGLTVSLTSAASAQRLGESVFGSFDARKNLTTTAAHLLRTPSKRA